jgi:hypothetical protein
MRTGIIPNSRWDNEFNALNLIEQPKKKNKGLQTVASSFHGFLVKRKACSIKCEKSRSYWPDLRDKT